MLVPLPTKLGIIATSAVFSREAFTPACAVCLPFFSGNECNRDFSTVECKAGQPSTDSGCMIPSQT
jgi:hypothetical protein